jgi:hypothetical protein
MTSAMERDAAMGGANGAPRQGDQLQAAATGLIDQAARTAEAQASTTMTKVGETLASVADAIRDAGQGLREQQPEIAGLTDTAAERVQAAATYLRDHDAGEALENVQRAARSNPALVIGGGLALGLVLGRLLRGGASAVQEQQGGQYGARGYGAYGAGGYGGREYGAGGYGAGSYGEGSYGSTAGGYGGGTGYGGGAGGGTGYDAGYGGAGAAATGATVISTTQVIPDSDVGSELTATDLAADAAYDDDDLLDDTATGDATRDEAPTAEGR